MANLHAEVGPMYETNKEVIWESSNPEVVSVNQNGRLFGEKPGTATIIAKAADNPENLQAVCQVEVIEKVDNVAFQKPVTASGEIGGGTEYPLKNATDGITDVENNWVGSVGEGKQWFQVDLEDEYELTSLHVWRFFANGGRIYHDCVIQLSNDPTFTTGVVTVYNNDTDNSSGFGAGTEEEYLETSEGKVIELETPVKARYIRLWSNGSDKFPNSNELVEIMAYAIDRVEEISLDKTKAEIRLGESIQLNVSLIPEYATNQAVEWTSSRPQTIAVDQNGLVTAVGVASATITATSLDGGLSATCEVKALDSLDNVAYLKPVTASAEVGGGTDFPLRNATDGITDVENNWVGNVGAGPQWYLVDLEEEFDLGSVHIWRIAGRTYRDCIIQLSTDPNFEENVTTVYNNDTDNSSGLGAGEDEEYVETTEGMKIVFDGPVRARYIKLWSRGSNMFPNSNDMREVKAYCYKDPGESFDITVPEAENGRITADKATAAEGDSIKLTVEAHEGYQLKNLKVKSASDDSVEVEVAEDYSFIMPAFDVVVTAEFELIEVPVEVDKSLLQKTYDYALTLDTKGVVESAVKYFDKVLAEAKAVLDNEKATQEEVNTAWDNLLEGIWGLGLTQGDKTMLEQLIAKAETMVPNQDKYVPDNWQQLVDALDAAKKVMNDGDAMKEDVVAAAEALMNAILSQRYKADKSILEDLINKVSGMDLSLYTAESVSVFKAALAEAKVVLADESLSKDDQKVVDAAVQKLESAAENLEKLSDTSDEENKPEDSNTKPENKPDSPTTGDSHAFLWISVILVLTTGSIMLYFRKREIMD